jgi:dihydroorotase
MTLYRKNFNVSDCLGLYLLRGGKYWDLKTSDFVKADIIIDNGIIKDIGEFKLDSFKGNVINVKDKLIFPGFMDMHVHFREPGREDEETIATGSQSATVGGFTAVCPMPNTEPVIDNQEIVRFILEKGKNVITDVLPIGAVSKSLKGEEISEIADMVNAGVVAISDDGAPILNLGLMRRCMEYVSMFDIPLIAHCEEKDLSEEGVMNEGFYSTKLGLSGMPRIAEEIAVMRNIMIAEYTRCKLHIAHVSTAGSLEIIKNAKDRGINITCEVSPHHLVLTDKSIESFDSNFKMNPPLRTQEDIEKLKDGLKNGIIDVIATDHAPHSIEEKEGEFDKAPFGVIGLETAFGIINKFLIEQNMLTIEKMVEKLIINPRKILKIDLPVIEKNKKANLVIVQMNKVWTVKEEDFFSLSRNSPFIGMEITGYIQAVFNKNKVWVNID